MARYRKSKTNTTYFGDIPKREEGKRKYKKAEDIIVVRGNLYRPEKCPKCGCSQFEHIENEHDLFKCASCGQKIRLKEYRRGEKNYGVDY